MNNYNYFLRFASVIMLILGLNGCQLLVPVNVTESIKIDDSDIALVQTKGEFIDLFPIIRIMQNHHKDIRQRFPIELNDKLQEEFTNEVLKAHEDSVVSHQNNHYQILRESRIAFTPIEDYDEMPKKSLKEALSNVFMSKLVVDDEGHKIVHLDLKTSNRFMQNNEALNSTKKINVEEIKNDFKKQIYKDSLYTIVIETNQQVLTHNAQKTQPIEGTDQIRYEWQFNYDMILDNSSKEDLLVEFILMPATNKDSDTSLVIE